jgi:hypothetical protein
MTQIRTVAFVIAISACAYLHSLANAQVVSILPFKGEWSEGFEDIPTGGHSNLPILTSNSDGEFLGTMASAFITSASTFMGSTVVASEGSVFAHSSSPIDITFAMPIHQFGAYVATNSGASGGLVQLFDADNQLITTLPLDVTFMQGTAPHTWNGWSSAIGFSRIRISSNGVLQGFLGIDDLQANVIPAPAAVLPMMLAACVAARRRRYDA